MLKDLCFEIIQTCPNECKFCSSNSSKNAQTIVTLENFKKTVNYFMKQGRIGEISISGGEPFLHPDLFEMVRFCKELGIRTVIFTSGIKRKTDIPKDARNYIIEQYKKQYKEITSKEPWNERLKESLNRYYDFILQQPAFGAISRQELEYLKQLGLDKIVFDMQAVDQTIDENLMGRKNLNTYLINSLVRASAVGLNIDVHFIPMKPNYKQFPDVIECLEIANIQNISILNFVPQGRGRINSSELLLSREQLQEFAQILQREKAHFKGNIRVGIPLNGKMSHMCTAGTEKLDIKYDGTILPCPAFKELNLDTMKKYGIKLHSIYEDLEQLVIKGGTRDSPLCRQVYGFKGDLIDETEEKDII